MTIFSSALQALLLFGRMALVTIVFIVVSRTVGAALAVLGMGLNGVVIGYVVGSTASLAVAIVFLRGKFAKTNLNSPIRPLLLFSFPLVLSSVLLLVLNWADVVIVTLLIGDYSLTGVYYIAVNSVTALSILWIPLSTTIMPALSAKKGLNRSEDITEIIRVSSRYIVYIVVPACIGLALVSGTALNFFYGSAYVEGSLPLSVLSVASIVTAFFALVMAALTALGKTTQILKIYGVSALVSIVALVLTVLPFKIVGAAGARLITQMTSLALAFFVLRKEVKVQIDSEGVWKSVVASAAFIPFILVFDALWGKTLSVTVRLVAEIGTSFVIYAFCLYVLRALKSQDFELIRQALPKALSRLVNAVERIMT
jgi:O-antigen/teichoic acid export membrane protein